MRNLKLAVCDFNNNILCDLYDNNSSVSGQATNVFLRSERNGWKELSFTVPSTCLDDEEGEIPNYRLDYLIADYKIRYEDDYEIDWFVISGPKVTHRAFSKNVEVVAGHISQRLKMKNLDLEFSDEEGNNVGTASQLLDAILAGTGWRAGNVATFYEDDGITEKTRSLKAAAKTGAFKLITDMCDLFEAKATFHGDVRTVDVLPMNPFAREIRVDDGHIYVGKPILLEEGKIPDIVEAGNNVLEIHYDKNSAGITRTLNTENMVTKLYCYGSYGDRVDGLCTLQKVKHNKYEMSVSTANKEYKFNAMGETHFFTADETGTYTWSSMDPASRSYVWHDKAYHVYGEPKTHDYIDLGIILPTQEENHFSYLMDFNYYDKVGLLTDEMFQKIAAFQNEMPQYLIQAEEASAAFMDKQDQASKVGESMSGLAKLDVASYSRGEGNALIVHLNKNTYEDGVIYRTDYDEAKRNRFTWHVVNKLKENGDPYSGSGSVLFIVHDTEPVTWEMAYLHKIDDRYHTEVIDEQVTIVYDDYVYGVSEGEPSQFELWLNYDKVPQLKSTDRFYLLCTKSLTGYLGAKQVEDEAAVQTIQSTTKTVTETHPTYFEEDKGTAPTTSITEIANSFGWCYLFNPNNYDIGKLYFCYGAMGDQRWYKTYCQDTEPTGSNGEYFLNTKTKELFHKENGSWVLWDSVEDKRIATYFSKISYYTLRRDMLYKGVYEKYQYNGSLTIGNYAIKSKFGFFWVFTTDRYTTNPWLDTDSYCIYQDSDVSHIVSVDSKLFDTVEYPAANIFEGVNFVNGTFNNDGTEKASETDKRSYNINIYENTAYEFNLPTNSFVMIYDHHKNLLQKITTSGHGTFTSPNHSYYLRISSPSEPTDGHYIHVQNYEKMIYVNEKLYEVLDDSKITASGLLKGINYLTRQFADLTDEAYQNYLPALQAAQKVVSDRNEDLALTLGDIYREGWWQNSDYVEGDEDKLYKDGFDNLVQVSKPEATYDIDFLDLYGNKNPHFSVEEDDETEWPDIQITDAAHVVDPEIDVNLWAYLDVLNKCFDAEWKTQLSINTNLSPIGQHSFTDVMSTIADVANQTKARQAIYERASNIGPMGQIASDKLEGTIMANVNSINGGATSWYTDNQGNMIFESADGMSAMKLSGAGWMLATARDPETGDWIWRMTASRAGLSADEITTGTLSAKLIQAGGITVDKVSSSFGHELEIYSNKALELYATEDGTRPAGTLKTTDALISIKAGKGSTPAVIDVKSGGNINMEAGAKLKANAADIQIGDISGFTNLGGKISDMDQKTANALSAAGTADSHAGTAQQTANNIANGTTAVPHVKAGEAGIHIYKDNAGNGHLDVLASGSINMVANSSLTLASSSSGSAVVMNKNGIAIGSHESIAIAAGGKLIMNAEDMQIGNLGFTSLAGKLSDMDDKTGTAQSTANTAKTNAATAQNTANAAATAAANIANGTTSVPHVKAGEAGVHIYKDSSGNGHVDIGASGSITMAANSSLTIASSSSNSAIVLNKDGISVGSGANVAIAATGSFSVASGADLSIRSPNFNVYKDGSTYKVDINGKITTTEGKIGGWNIGQYTLSSGSNSNHVELNSNGDYAFFAGATSGANAPFWVKKDGSFKATNGTFTGNITVGSTFAGTMSADCINSGHLSANYISGGTIDASNVSVTNISANNINTGTLDADIVSVINLNANNIKTGTLSADKINGGTLTLGGSNNTNGSIAVKNASGAIVGTWDNTGISIKGSNITLDSSASLTLKSGSMNITSGSFTITSTNFKLKSDGSVYMKGEIEASSGKIGGWTIGQYSLSAGSNSNHVELNSNGDYAFFAGASSGASAPFWVKRDGSFKATNGTFTGNIQAGSTMSADCLSGGSIDASKISVTNLSANNISGGTLTLGGSNNTNGSISVKNASGTVVGTWDNSGLSVKGSTITLDSSASLTLKSGSMSITSGSFTIDSTNFKLKSDGSAYLSGEIQASSGKIGGWSIGQYSLSAGTNGNHVELNSNGDYAFFAGASSGASAPFYVKKDGSFKATNGTFTGNITAGSTMSADCINGGTLTLGGSNNVNGSLSVKNASGTVIGSWDKSGISISSGSITISNGSFTMTSDNFNIKSNGTVEIKGKVEASSGQIAGWTINGSQLLGTNSLVGLEGTRRDDGTVAIWVGTSGPATSTPFRVQYDGTLYATKANIEGSITATSGQIAGWVIDGSILRSADWMTGFEGIKRDNGTIAIWVGSAGATSSTPFRVQYDGTLYSTNAHITGEINATSGKIAGWYINGSLLMGRDSSNNSWMGLDGTRVDGETTAIWVGTSAPLTNSPFRVTYNGKVYSQDLSIINGGSFKVGDNFSIKNNGDLTIGSNFSVTNTGSLTAKSGIIAGWTISGTQLLGTNSMMGLEGQKQNDATTAIWVGSAGPQVNSPFRVTYDGKVYITRLMTVDEDGHEREINVAQQNFNPAGSVVVSSWSHSTRPNGYPPTAIICNVVATLSNGKSESYTFSVAL